MRWAVLAVCASAAVAAGAAAPSPAHASRLSDKRAEAARVEQELNRLNVQVDLAVESYDKAGSQLQTVRAQIAKNRARLAQARRDLQTSQRQLARLLVAGYKGQGGDVAVYVLAATSFTDLVDRLDFVQRTSHEQAGIEQQIQNAERQIQARQIQLRAEGRTAARLFRQANRRRQHVEGLVAHEKTVLAGIKSDIATLIKQAQARRDRLARERAAKAAAAAAAAAAQPSPPPSSGDGGGGGGSSSGGGSPPPVVVPPAGTLGQKAVAIAMGELGVPYVWGGASPSGFDCSGLTMWVYAQLGVHLDHFTGSQWNAGPHVSQSQLEPGDLVFFEPGIGHVGIYIGNGSFIHAPHTGDVVRISSLSDPWYASEYQGAVRIVG